MQKIHIKKLFLLSICLFCYLLIASGCGSSGGDSQISTQSANDSRKSTNDQSSARSDKSTAETTEGGIDNTSGEQPQKASAEINAELLVYTCTISIDTLDYEKSVQDFKQMVSDVNGFLESEQYSDGEDTTRYYIEESEKNKCYTTTVRIPQDKYEEFLGNADNLGDVRSKSSDVENVSQEYTDLNTSLEIYEAKEKRYIKMLADITDDSYAVTIEKELTELQIQIAQLKTRMKEIETDVAYSTINMTIREVSKYSEEPEQTDTFGQRLKNTFRKTWKTFLVVSEGVLFLAIQLSPYAIVIALIILLFVFINKKKKRQRNSSAGMPRQNEMIQFTDFGVPNDEGSQSDKEQSNDTRIQMNDKKEV